MFDFESERHLDERDVAYEPRDIPVWERRESGHHGAYERPMRDEDRVEVRRLRPRGRR